MGEGALGVTLCTRALGVTLCTRALGVTLCTRPIVTLCTLALGVTLCTRALVTLALAGLPDDAFWGGLLGQGEQALATLDTRPGAFCSGNVLLFLHC